MKKKSVISFILVLVVLSGMILSGGGGGGDWLKGAPYSKKELREKIDELYASDINEDESAYVKKMQAFIMEIALHAKNRKSSFKIIPQDEIYLLFEDGDEENEPLPELLFLVDGWGKEGAISATSSTLSAEAQLYGRAATYGLFISNTATANTEANLQQYYTNADILGVIPYPRIGGPVTGESLAQTLFPGKRWATNSDYFWIEDPDVIGLSSRINDKNINELTDAENYLYHINGRPFDAWETWDDEEEAAIAEGSADRTRITAGYASGLLVPFEGGRYTPSALTNNGGTNPNNTAVTDQAISDYGTEWDWWWVAKGYTAKQGREIWLKTLRESPYDVIYIDSFYNHRALPENHTPLTKKEVDSLKRKPNGARRQIIAYLSVGSAEQNRWYCQDDWTYVDPEYPNSPRMMKSGYFDEIDEEEYVFPEELLEEIPAWLTGDYGGSYGEESLVMWWHPEWRDIIVRGGSKYHHKTTGSNKSSIDRIIDQGFDGVYLDNVGVYDWLDWQIVEEFWEDNYDGIPGMH